MRRALSALLVLASLLSATSSDAKSGADTYYCLGKKGYITSNMYNNLSSLQHDANFSACLRVHNKSGKVEVLTTKGKPVQGKSGQVVRREKDFLLIAIFHTGGDTEGVELVLLKADGSCSYSSSYVTFFEGVPAMWTSSSLGEFWKE